MSVQRESDSDAAEQAWRQSNAERVAKEARSLTGEQAITIRHALDSCASALSALNTKGLPFRVQRQLEAARATIEPARRILNVPTQSAERQPLGHASSVDGIG